MWAWCCFIKKKYNTRDMRAQDDKPKQEKYDFEKMKSAAMHADPAVRKQVFIDYFERFGEFPSYLFDNETKMDDRLYRTVQDLQSDPDTSRAMQTGLTALINRLPSNDLR